MVDEDDMNRALGGALARGLRDAFDAELQTERYILRAKQERDAGGPNLACPDVAANAERVTCDPAGALRDWSTFAGETVPLSKIRDRPDLIRELAQLAADGYVQETGTGYKLLPALPNLKKWSRYKAGRKKKTGPPRDPALQLLRLPEARLTTPAYVIQALLSPAEIADLEARKILNPMRLPGGKEYLVHLPGDPEFLRAALATGWDDSQPRRGLIYDNIGGAEGCLSMYYKYAVKPPELVAQELARRKQYRQSDYGINPTTCTPALEIILSHIRDPPPGLNPDTVRDDRIVVLDAVMKQLAPYQSRRKMIQVDPGDVQEVGEGISISTGAAFAYEAEIEPPPEEFLAAEQAKMARMTPQERVIAEQNIIAREIQWRGLTPYEHGAPRYDVAREALAAIPESQAVDPEVVPERIADDLLLHLRRHPGEQPTTFLEHIRGPHSLLADRVYERVAPELDARVTPGPVIGPPLPTNEEARALVEGPRHAARVVALEAELRAAPTAAKKRAVQARIDRETEAHYARFQRPD